MYLLYLKTCLMGWGNKKSKIYLQLKSSINKIKHLYRVCHHVSQCTKTMNVLSYFSNV